MKTSFACLFASLAAAPSNAGSVAASQHPIAGVIDMLQGLASTAESEGKTEALAYEKFEYWCKNTLKELNKAISEETAEIESLKDKIAAGEQEEADLTAGIAALETQLGERDTAAGLASQRRNETAALYAQTSSDLTATITAVESATAALEASGNANFLQVVYTPVVQEALALAQAAAPESKQAAIGALLQQPDFKTRPDFEAEGDRAAHVQKYEFKSGDIIETLKTLRMQFEEELLAATKGETDSINAYNLAKQERDHVIATATADKAVKQGVLSDVQSTLTTQRSALGLVEGDKATDEDSRSDTDKACLVKKQEWEQRSNVRKSEIEAIGAAVQILSKASGVRTEAPGNPVPPPSPAAALLQKRAVSLLQVTDPRAKALNLLRSKAHKLHSSALERLAQQLSAHLDDPFGVVINNIEKMIFHLMDEQRQEDEHKAWCDQELSHNNASKVDKEEKINELTLKIESADAMVVQLSSEIGAAQAHIAEIVAWMEESSEIRAIGKNENDLAIADAQKAQAAVADATSVIVSFYKESGMIAKESWEALVQRQPVTLSAHPDTWAASYTGVAAPENQPDGIVAVLKQVGADFATMEADTRAQEAADQAQFEEDIKENKIAKAEREQEVQTKNAEKNRQTDIIGALTATRKHTSDELEQVEQYLHDLIPACVAGDSTYDDRKAARAEETEALRQAQSILTDAFKEGGSPAPAPATATNFLRATVHRHA